MVMSSSSIWNRKIDISLSKNLDLKDGEVNSRTPSLPILSSRLACWKRCNPARVRGSVYDDEDDDDDDDDDGDHDDDDDDEKGKTNILHPPAFLGNNGSAVR